MFEISLSLREAINEANLKLNKKFEEEMVHDKAVFKRMVNVRIDKIRQIEPKTINVKDDKRGVAGVDGSIYTEGTSFPHYISIMQAKTKSTVKGQKEIMLAAIHSPLLEQDQEKTEKSFSGEEKDKKLQASKLAFLEIKTALKALDTMNPFLILVDGPLTRYDSASIEDWELLKRKAKASETGILGIIEEIKTAEISKRLNGLIPESQENMCDREMLFGMLDIGEMFVLKGWESNGIKKCFIRTSNDLQAIGIEFLEEQEEMINEYLSMVLVLTPKDSRGIPLWLDIVDSEVRITEKVGKALIENYIDSKLRHKLFSAKRNKRKY